MANLEGKTIFVAGGAGSVGEGLVRSLLKANATVFTISRKQKKLDELRSRLGQPANDQLITFEGSLGDFESGESVRDNILSQCDQLSGVVASLGSTWHGNKPITEIAMEDWQQYIFTNLTTHFVCARTFLPILKAGSSYTLLGGAAAESVLPNYSLVGIPAAGQLMMAKILMKEAGQDIRINEVMINSMVNTRNSKAEAAPEWITADEIGDYVAWLVSDEAAMMRSSVPHLQEQPRDRG